MTDRINPEKLPRVTGYSLLRRYVGTHMKREADLALEDRNYGLATERHKDIWSMLNTEDDRLLEIYVDYFDDPDDVAGSIFDALVSFRRGKDVDVEVELLSLDRLQSEVEYLRMLEEVFSEPQTRAGSA